MEHPQDARLAQTAPSLTLSDLPGLGRLYAPAGSQPVPHVLVLHGSEGAWSGFAHLHAAMLATRGFAALPFGYSVGGNAWNAGRIESIPIDKTAAALDALRALPGCNGKAAIYGLSRGAEHALLLASLTASDPEHQAPDAVAVHAPPDVVCGAFDAREWRDSGDPGWQSWDPARRAWTWKGKDDGLLPTQPIAIERYPGPLFISVGDQDQTWAPAMSRRLAERYARSGRVAELLAFEREGHVLSAEASMLRDERLATFFARHLA